MNKVFFHSLLAELAETPQKAQLIAVTKYSSVDETNEAIQAGVTKIGENRVELLEEKSKSLLPVEKHFIGTIQSKKLRRILKVADVIESIDSLEHLEKLNCIAEEEGKIAKVFLQFNISGEAQKSGFKSKDIDMIKKCIQKLNNISVQGVMGMAENTQDDEEIRKQFKLAKKIFDTLKKDIPTLKELSIGMSHDYKIALEEGATIIRIGSALFQ